MRITFLGTGTSHGVPTIDCMLSGYTRCPHDVCRRAASEPRYRRLRASIWIQAEQGSLLIDTSQDFRQQMLEQRVPRIDTVLYTHGHADHIYGLPDIRSYCAAQHDGIDIYGSPETLAILDASFDYVFHPPLTFGGGIPNLRPHPVCAPLEWRGLRITPLPVVHGPLNGCQGYRIGDMAYLPDVHVIPESTLDLLHGLDLLILNCLRDRPHSTHLSLEESLAYVHALKPRRCLLTHMTHDIDYQIEEPRLPAWIRFAYDGLIVEV
jgi:phosphoribosyl 1,2-cyclic phosphate phosphodiesterase